MKQITKIITVEDYRRENCSIYGNPSKTIYGWTENGERFTGRTARNAGCGYLTIETDDKLILEYHTTRKGNNIIDFITIIK